LLNFDAKTGKFSWSINFPDIWAPRGAGKVRNKEDLAKLFAAISAFFVAWMKDRS
jgi:hypothetical protein